MNSGQLREEQKRIEQLRLLLQKKCVEILNMHGYQRHDYGKNKTHCNRASERIAREMGYNTDFMHYRDRSGNIGIVGTANHIYYEALKAEKRKEIFRIDEDKAKQLAWYAEVIILTAAAPAGKSGHIAIVYPNPPTEKIMVCNVGWWNLLCSPWDRKSFGGGKSYLIDPIYFHLRRKI
jgi:hypothetical protein